MNLKENTKYRLRNGMEVGPLKYEGVDFWVWRGGSMRGGLAMTPMWKDSGRYDSYIMHDNDPAFDIVEEL